MIRKNNLKIAVIGLGYVGFPLACLFAKKYSVIGYDIDADKVKNLINGKVGNIDVDIDVVKQLLDSKSLRLTSSQSDVADCNVYIVAVPTPTDNKLKADPTLLYQSSVDIGSVLSPGNIVIYESTVWPGMTEEECVPRLEKSSGLKYNEDFFVGYSPERINPSDKDHSVANTKKVTSGSNSKAAAFVDKLYSSVLLNGTYKASSIKVAETCKMMENCQRDVLIAFANEMLGICQTLGIDFDEANQGAATKWNYVKMNPGFVGGHCIAVDPYYMIDKASAAGYNPTLLKSARCVNSKMAPEFARHVIVDIKSRGLSVGKSRVLLLGFSFKADCEDIRNTRAYDIYEMMNRYTHHITIFDPYVNADKVKADYGVDVETDEASLSDEGYDAVVICTSHSIFKKPRKWLKNGGRVYTLKNI